MLICIIVIVYFWFVLAFIHCVCYLSQKSQRVCESEIPWYQSIRETQGSVEKSSFGQMRSINELGFYEIGSIRKGILSNRSEAIRLQLRKPDDKTVTLPQYHYSLDELRDLESKLVLITGPESSERQEVDRFLDVSTFNFIL